MEYKKIYNENYSLAHYDKIPITKNNIQMNKELNVRTKTMKFLEDSIGNMTFVPEIFFGLCVLRQDK